MLNIQLERLTEVELDEKSQGMCLVESGSSGLIGPYHVSFKLLTHDVWI